MRRASHQLLDDPKIFDDPLALRVLGPQAIAELQSDSREIPTGRVNLDRVK